MIEQKDCTIIIPHYGSTDEQCNAIDECMESLDQTVPDMKKIISKNGFQCKRHHIRNNTTIVKLVEQGQCKAVNAAVATTDTPWIFITNDDMIYAPGWFEKLTNATNPRFLVSNKIGLTQEDLTFQPHGIIPVDNINAIKRIDDIVCVSPMLIEPRPGAPTFMVQFLGGAGGDFNKQGWLHFAENYTANIGIRTGFNFPLFLKRDLWDMIGGYDINYDPWGSNGDSDLEYKIMLAGVQPYQNTNCIVYHFSQTSGTFHPDNNDYLQRNYAYFKEKWGFDRTDNGIWEANFLIPTKEEGRIFLPEWEGKYSK